MMVRKKLMSIAVASIFGAALSPVAFAADADSSATARSEKNQALVYWGIRGSDLIDMEVRNAQGEELGEITDVIVDVKNGHAHYAIMAFDAKGWTVGDKSFAYPLSAFKPGDEKLVLNVGKEKLVNAPGFDPNDDLLEWFDRPEYKKYIGNNFPQAKPVAKDARLARLSDVLDQDINAGNGSEIGEVEDVVINLTNGQIHYALAELDTWGLGDSLFALPLTAFGHNAKSDDFVLNVDKNRIDTKRGIEANDWETMNINDPNYVRDIDVYLITLVPTNDPGAAGRAGTPSTDKSAKDDAGSMSDKPQPSGSTK